MTRPRRAKVEAAPPAPATRRCAIYTRKSTTVGPDVSLSSLDAQRDVGLAYVEARRTQGWQALPDRYDDGGYTGANLERPAFRRLLADIEAGAIDVVIVYKVDRLSRSLLDFAQVMGAFDRHGVAFVSVTQHFSTADAMGRLTLNLLISFAEFEREMISERTRDKIAASRRRGHWTGGVVPVGYRSVDRKLVVDAATAPGVRAAFARYVETRSILAVARHLDATAPRRGPGGSVRPWTRNDVRRLLDNHVYAGLLRAGDELTRAAHEPLIDRTLFDQAQGTRERAGQWDRPTDDSYLLRGLARCAVCGAALVPATTRRGRKVHRYYRCLTRDRRGAAACSREPVRADQLEALVLTELTSRVADGRLAAPVLAQAQAQVEARRHAVQDERRAAAQALVDATRRGEVVAHALAAAGVGERTDLERQLTEALAAAAAADRSLTALDTEGARLAEAQVDEAWVCAAMANLGPVWEALQPAERVRLVARTVERVEVGRDRTVAVHWQPWLAGTAEAP